MSEGDALAWAPAPHTSHRMALLFVDKPPHLPKKNSGWGNFVVARACGGGKEEKMSSLRQPLALFPPQSDSSSARRRLLAPSASSPLLGYRPSEREKHIRASASR